MHDTVVSEGLAAASQAAIAERAHVTQSAVRHYFPTKDGLLIAFFSDGIERIRKDLASVMADEGTDARAKLLESASAHYERVLETEDAYLFEALAFSGRYPDFQALRDEWWQDLDHHYTKLLKKIHPQWSKQRCAAVSFQILTLVLGSWLTMGSSQPVRKQGSRASLSRTLLQGIQQLID
jgi:AcrR family transcriptional regulator